MKEGWNVNVRINELSVEGYGDELRVVGKIEKKWNKGGRKTCDKMKEGGRKTWEQMK